MGTYSDRSTKQILLNGVPVIFSTIQSNRKIAKEEMELTRKYFTEGSDPDL
jgi:hypothetical protein